VAALLLTGGDDEEAAQSEEPGAGAQAEDEANSEGEGGSEGEGDSDDEGPVAEVVEPESQQTLDTSRREEGDALAAGDVEAPVSLVVYSDYQCPYCAVWIQDTQPTVMEYVESGDVRLEWRDVNIYGEPSRRGAIAAQAAGEQDAFWKFHDALMDEGEKASEEELSEASLIDLAEELGLDAEQFAEDMNDPEIRDAVARNEDEGNEVGAFSTPSFLIGGHPVVG